MKELIKHRTRDRRSGRNGRVVPLLVALLAACSTVFVAVTPAVAASANSGIYGVAPEWGGFCRDAGRLNNYATSVTYVNFTTGDRGGDSGDDVVWIRVRNGVRNSVQINVTCRWSTPIGMSYTITPRRYGQTFWFSTWGQYWSN
jgi:hypothetical protein